MQDVGKRVTHSPKGLLPRAAFLARLSSLCRRWLSSGGSVGIALRNRSIARKVNREEAQDC